MPKIKEFNIENYSNYDIQEFVSKKLKQKAQENAKESSYLGMKIGDNTSLKIMFYGIRLKDEEADLLRIDTKFLKDLKKYYEEEKNKKIEKYNKLKSKLDYCLHDVKPYHRLLKILDELTYCIALDELEKIERSYLKSNSSSKALCRSRQSEYNKIECK